MYFSVGGREDGVKYSGDSSVEFKCILSHLQVNHCEQKSYYYYYYNQNSFVKKNKREVGKNLKQI